MSAGPGAKTDKTVDDDTRKGLLMAAIEAGARYVDVEVQADEAYKRDIIQKARIHGCKVIISFHDFQATPEKGKLEEITALCFKEGADIAKIACKVKYSKRQHPSSWASRQGGISRKDSCDRNGEKRKNYENYRSSARQSFYFCFDCEGKRDRGGTDRKKHLKRDDGVAQG